MCPTMPEATRMDLAHVETCFYNLSPGASSKTSPKTIHGDSMTRKPYTMTQLFITLVSVRNPESMELLSTSGARRAQT